MHGLGMGIVFNRGNLLLNRLAKQLCGRNIRRTSCTKNLASSRQSCKDCNIDHEYTYNYHHPPLIADDRWRS